MDSSDGEPTELDETQFKSFDKHPEISSEKPGQLWIRATIHNMHKDTPIIVKHPAALAKGISVYRMEQGSYVKVGRSLANQLSINLFTSKKGHHKYLFKVDTDILRLHIELWSQDRFMQEERRDNLVFGAFYILVFFSTLVCIALAYWHRDRRFVSYALVTISTFLFFICQSGVIRLHLPSEFFASHISRIYGVTISFFIMSIVLNLYELLDLKHKTQSLTARLGQGLILLAFLAMLLLVLGVISYQARIAQVIIFSSIIFAAILLFLHPVKGLETKIVAWSWLVLFAHGLIFTSYLRGYLPYNWYVSRSVYLGIVLQNVIYMVVILLKTDEIRRREIKAVEKLAVAEDVQKKEHESRLAAQSLVHILCHDLANPLLVTQGNLQLAQTKADPSLKKYLDNAIKACDGIETIISIIRQQEAISSGKIKLRKQDVNLQNAIQEATELFASQAIKKHIRLEVVDSPPLFIMADQTVLVYSILANIISNAIKFSIPGESIIFRSFKKEGYIIVEIQDCGDGIPEQLLAKLFDESQHTSRAGTSGEKGTGFGTLQIKKYTELFSGILEIDSRTGENSGTTFRLKFPDPQIS